MPFATTPDGTRLYFETHGTGTPLLLLSGQASDHREWDGVRADFTAFHRVIVLDYRGTGQSDKPSAPAYSTRRVWSSWGLAAPFDAKRDRDRAGTFSTEGSPPWPPRTRGPWPHGLVPAPTADDPADGFSVGLVAARRLLPASP
jgi:hypothetical protein